MDENPNPARSSPAEAADPARLERRLLSDALAEAGPDAPTLCRGWDAADLVAHLLVREGRLDAGPGIVLPPLAPYTDRVRRRTREREPFPRMVERFRAGPPRFSVYALPGVDKAANAVEFFVHHEDVRRARPEWEPRALPAGQEALLWRRLKMVRLVMRKVPVEVTFVGPDGRTLRAAKGTGRGSRGTRGPGGAVRVHGEVGELVMWGLGRRDAARVRLTGDEAAVRALTAADWRI